MGNIKENIKSICRKTKEKKEQAFLQTATTMYPAEVYLEEEKEKILQLTRIFDEGR